MQYNIKPGVSIAKLTPQMAMGYTIIMAVGRELSIDVIVTSGDDGKHMENSKHYDGNALDFRIRHVDANRRRFFQKAVQEALGSNFDVVLEPTHLHVEYDPGD